MVPKTPNFKNITLKHKIIDYSKRYNYFNNNINHYLFLFLLIKVIFNFLLIL